MIKFQRVFRIKRCFLLAGWVGLSLGSVLAQDGLIGRFVFEGGSAPAESGLCRLENIAKAKPTEGGLLFGKSAPAAPELVIGKNISLQGTLAMRIKPEGWATESFHFLTGKDGERDWWLRHYHEQDKPVGTGKIDRHLRLFIRSINPDPSLSERAQRQVYNAFVDKGVAEWADGEWRHLAITWRRGAFTRFYVDGAFAGGTGPEGNWPPECLDRISFGGGRQSDTTLQELLVFDRALSAGELAVLAAGKGSDRQAAAVIPERGGISPDSILPLSLAEDSPVLDGRIAAGEYPTAIEGLIDIGTHSRWRQDSGVVTAVDNEWLYVGAWLQLPPGRAPPRTIQADHQVERNQDADLFVLHLQDREAQTDDRVEGPYILVHPDGTVWDAESRLAWSPVSAQRKADVNYGVEAVSTYDEQTRYWTVELRIPRDVALPGSRAPLISLGFRYQKAVISLNDGLIWFDHPSAFSRTVLTPLGVRTDFSRVVHGVIEPDVRVINSTGQTVSGSVGVVISEPDIGVRGSDYNFDEVLDPKLDVQILGIMASLSEPFEIPAQSRGQIELRGRFEQEGLCLLDARVQAEGRDLLRRSVPFVRMTPISVINRLFPSDQRVESDVVFSNMEVGPGWVLRLRVADEEGKILNEQIFDAAVNERTVIWSMATVPAGSHTLHWSLKGPGGEVTAELQQTFEKWPEQPWQTERLALEALTPDWCPAPWIPLEAEHQTLRLWGRTLEYGNGSLLPVITSQGQELLGRPVRIGYQKEGASETVGVSDTTVQLQGRGRAKVLQSGGSRDFDLIAEQTVEFDGLIWIDMTLSPRAGPVRIEGMQLEIPLESLPWVNCDGEIILGEIPDRDLFHSDNKALLFSGEEIGLAWIVENYAGWKVDSGQPRLSLRKAADGRPARFIMHLANTSVTVDEPMRIRFGLQPTPVKPLNSAQRDFRFSTMGDQGWQGPSEMNVTSIHNLNWALSHGTFRPRTWNNLNAIVDAAAGLGIRSYAYITLYQQGLYEMKRRDEPDFSLDFIRSTRRQDRENYELTVVGDEHRLPESWYFMEEWRAHPLRIGGIRPNFRFYDCALEDSFVDYNLWHLRDLLKKTGLDGIYVDLGKPNTDLNPARGHRVVTLDGQEEGTIGWLSARDYVKRAYWLFDQYRGQEKVPYILMHGYPVHLITHSFSDMIFHGEWIKPGEEYTYAKSYLQREVYRPIKGRVTTAPPDAERSASAPVLRSSFGTQAVGIPMMLLPQYDKGSAPAEVRRRLVSDPRMARELLAFTAPTDVRLWAGRVNVDPILTYWRNVEMAFGMADTEFFGYWDNGVQTSDPAVKVSYYKKNGTGDYLVLVANWSENPVKATVTLPEALRGLGGAADMEKPGVTLPVSPVLQLEIPGYDLRALRISRR